MVIFFQKNNGLFFLPEMGEIRI